MKTSKEGAPQKPTLSELQCLAAVEDWLTIDPLLDAVADEGEFLAWAVVGMEDDDPNIRDLAVSLFEASSIDLNQTTIDALTRHMQEDDNEYVQYRSAFALFEHGSRDADVISKIRSARDGDVASIAQAYLDSI